MHYCPDIFLTQKNNQTVVNNYNYLKERLVHINEIVVTVTNYKNPFFLPTNNIMATITHGGILPKSQKARLIER